MAARVADVDGDGDLDILVASEFRPKKERRLISQRTTAARAVRKGQGRQLGNRTKHQ